VVDEHDGDPLTKVVGGVQEPERIVSGELPPYAEIAAETALERSLDPVELSRIHVHGQQQRPCLATRRRTGRACHAPRVGPIILEVTCMKGFGTGALGPFTRCAAQKRCPRR
jgi:hypothetical protein